MATNNQAYREALRSMAFAISANDAVQVQLSDIVSRLGILEANDEATNDALDILAAAIAGKASCIALPDWEVVILAVGVEASLGAGNLPYTRTIDPSYGVMAGDAIFISPKVETPSGFIIGAASAPADNETHVVIGNPDIALTDLGVSILCSVFTLRP